MKITTDELRQAAILLLDHLDRTGQSNFEIEEDFYWNIPEEELYNPYKTPVDFDMGQLSDDIKEIQDIIISKSPCIGYGLVWLASVLRRVGEKSIG